MPRRAGTGARGGGFDAAPKADTTDLGGIYLFGTGASLECMTNPSTTLRDGETARESGQYRYRTGAKALVTSAAKVLLVRERHADGQPFWTLPGGGVHSHEAPRTDWSGNSARSYTAGPTSGPRAPSSVTSTRAWRRRCRCTPSSTARCCRTRRPPEVRVSTTSGGSGRGRCRPRRSPRSNTSVGGSPTSRPTGPSRTTEATPSRPRRRRSRRPVPGPRYAPARSCTAGAPRGR